MLYETIYSKRRTISFTIKNGQLIVRAPIGVKKEQIDKLIANHKDWIEKSVIQSKIKFEKENISKDEEVHLRKQAKQVLKEKVEYYSKIMNLKCNRVTITCAKTRFGSCSSKGNISFSFRLMKYPEAAIDYVVVHELAHLLELNHSRRFWNIVASVFPDYKDRKKLLKDVK